MTYEKAYIWLWTFIWADKFKKRQVAQLPLYFTPDEPKAATEAIEEITQGEVLKIKNVEALYIKEK